jgi:hypothetical protein
MKNLILEAIEANVIYVQENIPLIQNKTYPTLLQARSVQKVDIALCQSPDNGFVYNANFNGSLIDYDHHYQNEQSNSGRFREHLNQVIAILEENKLLGRQIIEIGCGKAFFMNMLSERGENILGFDPAYEGNSPEVIKDYFSDKYSEIGAETIILRHTLEHIPNPFEFLKTIAKANNYKGKIYIEVPTFEWIVEQKACEDIFYEHCNYFTLETLQHFFTESTGGHLFDGQYIYAVAKLSSLKQKLDKVKFKPYDVKFGEQLERYERMIENKADIAIWGAGAKGSTFLNLVDKYASKISCVVDINPKKQHQFIGGTGHFIIKPEELEKCGIKEIIVMNVNYLEEIRKYTEPLNIKLTAL